MTTDGTYTYEYDNEGNRTARFVDNNSNGTLDPGDTQITEYAWDYRNRLATVTNRATYSGDATQVVDYIYDVHNRLVGKILDPDRAGPLGAAQEYFAYDGDQILLRFDGPQYSDLADRYLWAPVIDLLLSDEKLTAPNVPGEIHWALHDNLGTVRDIARYNPATDTTGVVNHRAYDAYGKMTSEMNPAERGRAAQRDLPVPLYSSFWRPADKPTDTLWGVRVGSGRATRRCPLDGVPPLRSAIVRGHVSVRIAWLITPSRQ